MNPKTTLSTISDVAKHAGVSIATVSRVLNGKVPVQAEKAERKCIFIKFKIKLKKIE